MSAAPPSGRFVFGLVPTEAALDAGLNTLLRWLGARAGLRIIRRQVPSYEALSHQMATAAIDVAWLPPLVFVELEREGIAVPLVTNHRHGETVTVLIARADSHIAGLGDVEGTRVAWVDPLSASGYVFPRLHLAARGFDPRTMFAHEHFYGSHVAAVRAVLEQGADVACTFAGQDQRGAIVRSGWSEFEESASAAPVVRVVERLGIVPPDLIAVRANIPEAARKPLAGAFVDAYEDEELRPIIKRVFGVDAFSADGFASYEDLRRIIDDASAAGILDAAAPYSKTLPPGSPD